MPMYEWSCPQCSKVTATINRMVDSEVPPEKCQPQAERTDQNGEDGKPLYNKFEPCGYAQPEVWTDEKPTGWKKRIGSTNFILRGSGWAKDSYSKW